MNDLCDFCHQKQIMTLQSYSLLYISCNIPNSLQKKCNKFISVDPSLHTDTRSELSEKIAHTCIF